MSAAVANLDLHRRGLGSDFLIRGTSLIERYIVEVRLEGDRAEMCRDSLNGILHDASKLDDGALVHWRLIEKVMLPPFDGSCNQSIERIIAVSSLAANYWRLYAPGQNVSGGLENGRS